jgi:hypothetical protein
MDNQQPDQQDDGEGSSRVLKIFRSALDAHRTNGRCFEMTNDSPFMLNSAKYGMPVSAPC